MSLGLGIGKLRIASALAPVIDPAIPIINDGSTVIWFDYTLGATRDVNDHIVAPGWLDQSGLAHHLNVIGGTPHWTVDGILFDGIGDSLKTAAFAWIQPEFIYMVVKHITWTANDKFFDGNAVILGYVGQSNATPGINAYAGTASGPNNNLVLNTWGIVRCLFNGASSKLQVNATVPILWNCGVNNMGGFTLAARGNAGSQWGNIQVKEIIGRNVADTVANEALIYAYLKNKYGI